MKDGAARVRVVRRLRDHAVSVQDSGGHREHAEEDAESMFKGVRRQEQPGPQHARENRVADPHFFLGTAPKSVYQQELTDQTGGQEGGHACISMDRAQSPTGCRRDQGDQGEKHAPFFHLHSVPQIFLHRRWTAQNIVLARDPFVSQHLYDCATPAPERRAAIVGGAAASRLQFVPQPYPLADLTEDDRAEYGGAEPAKGTRRSEDDHNVEIIHVQHRMIRAG